MESKLLEIAEHLRSEDLEKSKFLCGGKVPRTVLRLSTTPIELVKRLHGLGLVTCSSTYWLRSMLEQIGRYDIVEKLSKYNLIALFNFIPDTTIDHLR